uniref:NADH dehydrogenase subunit 4 n=1 Tax=Taenioides cirratus TaxID=508012 RepID=A0A139Z3N0_9GOBI|nr:NADH dehydrogenase subunit 4 [Taenioides cirratus]
MLKILLPTIMLIPMTWLAPSKLNWPAALAHSLMIAIMSLTWLCSPHLTGWSSLNHFMALDPLSTPLLVLTCWLLPLMILASQNHTYHLSHWPTTNVHHPPHLPPNLPYYSLLSNRSSSVLCNVWGNPSTHSYSYHTLTKSNTTPKCWDMLSILYPCTLSSPLSCPSPPSKYHWHPLSSHPTMCPLLPPLHNCTQNLMSTLLTCFPCSNAIMWNTSLTASSPCTSPYCTLHSPSCCPTKTWTVWHNAYNNYTRTPNQTTQLPLHHPRSLGSCDNWLHLSTTNWPSITNCMLLSWTHTPCSTKHLNPNPLTIYWSTYPNNCTRTHLLCPFLPSKHQLWTHPHPDNSTSPTNTNNTPTNSILMIYCSPSKLSSAPSSSPHTTTNNYCITISLILGHIALTGLGPSLQLATPLHVPYTQRGPLPQHIIALDPSHTREHLLLALHLLPLILLIAKPELIWGWTF